MKNTQNITIVLLLVSAVLLTALLIGIHRNTARRADAQVTVRAGRYIVAVGTWSSSMDLVYVVDIATRKLNVYAASRAQRRLELLDSAEMEPVFKKIR